MALHVVHGRLTPRTPNSGRALSAYLGFGCFKKGIRICHIQELQNGGPSTLETPTRFKLQAARLPARVHAHVLAKCTTRIVDVLNSSSSLRTSLAREAYCFGV